MITNIPTKEDFQSIAIECWLQAFSIIFDSYFHWNEHLSLIKDDEEIDVEDIQEQVHKSNLQQIRTCVILIHQGIESIMKAAVCDETPLLLISTQKRDWPVLGKVDKDFNDLYTITAEELLYLYGALPGKDLTANDVKFIEKIRVLRNKIIHGSFKNKISIQDLISDILTCFTLFLGKNSFWVEYTNSYLSDPIFELSNTDGLEAQLAFRLDFIYEILGKPAFRKHLNFPIDQRRYVCPNCFEGAEYEEFTSKWATLSKDRKKPTVTCYSCNGVESVELINCSNEGCKGHVQAEMMGQMWCLTCIEPIEDGRGFFEVPENVSD